MTPVMEIMPGLVAEALYGLRFELFFAVGLLLLWASAGLMKIRTPVQGSRKGAKDSRVGAPRYAQETVREGLDAAHHLLEPPQIRRMIAKPQLLVKHVAAACRVDFAKALSMYDDAIRSQFDFSLVGSPDLEHLFVELVSASLRAGRTDGLVRFLQQLGQPAVAMPASLFSSITRMCAAKRLFKDVMSVYDAMCAAGLEGVRDSALWSTFLFCSVEAGEHGKSAEIFARFKKYGVPASRDYANMIRMAQTRKDWKRGLEYVKEMETQGQVADNVVYNTALAACVNAQQLDVAEELLAMMENVEGVADCITYNTLMKGYARAGCIEKCFDMEKKMAAKGISASQVTFGILLDACINDSMLDKALLVFQQMQRMSCPMNTVLYTTLIKGFARANDIDKVMELYAQMQNEMGVSADLVTFSILIKANCDASRMDVALQLLERLLELGHQPDEVIFNNLLNGCVTQVNIELGKKIFVDMQSAGVKPSCVTYSIILRMYTHGRRFDDAFELLNSMGSARCLEPRLYTQLILACIRNRQGRRVVDVYRMMVRDCQPIMHSHQSILDSCSRFNMFDTMAEIVALIADSGGTVSVREAHVLLEGILKKKRVGCMRAVMTAFQKMGISVDPKLQDAVNQCFSACIV